jgi:mono/diheme cytochrome c family protein
MKKRFAFSCKSIVLTILVAGFFTKLPEPTVSAAPSSTPMMVDQGPNWTSAARLDFYSRDQGSQIMPLRWMQALKQPNGAPFLADSLGRYGYLPHTSSDLPIGFTTAGSGGQEVVGMTCAACHTRQITVGADDYRIDGGPAIVDIQRFLTDLDVAVTAVLNNDTSFADFASTVLGPLPTAEATEKLRRALSDWHLPYHTLVRVTLSALPWGPARSDGLGLNFNRITGLDIGPPPTYMIAENIRPAAAPVRYPFLWNSSVQDKTEWAGFTDNGNDILALARNVGEVFGVFAVFHPKKDDRRPFGIDYLANNSVNIPNLKRLEDLVRKLGPPRWPWAVDQALASAGKAIFARRAVQGGCIECHGISPGRTRLLRRTWRTPVLDVGTDTKQHEELDWTAQTGVLNGARIPFLVSPLQPNDKSNNIQTLAVTGSVLQHYFPLKLPFAVTAQRQAQPPSMSPAIRSNARQLMATYNQALPKNAYEARVLQGIWAAAPYLHNGSVPSLAELLKPAAERVGVFQVGPAYDTVNIGLAAEQPVFNNYTLRTTDCGDRNSGNSRCGHEYGTQLTPAEKRALLEYLKML